MPSSPAQGELRGNVRVLQGLPLFGELADRDLVRLCRLARRVRVPAGEFVMREGAPGDGLYVILDGELEVTKREGDRDLPLARRGPGEFVGEMSLLEQEPRSASVRALRDSELLLIPPEEFQALLRENPATASGVLKAVAARLRSTEAALVERERLASLGTLAAGLAHELNNPASAIQRSISHLREALVPLRHPAPAPELVERLRMAKPAEPPPGEEGVREDALIDWLEDLGVDRSWEIAPPLAQAGWTPEALGQELARAGSPPEAPGREPAGGAREELGPILTRLAAELTVHQLLDEMEAGSATMSEIVQAVKRYSYMDRAPVQEVDLVESLESTLVMLRHRWKERVEIVRAYQENLPAVEAYGNELNHVWTNLIGNALEAMSSEGRLELEAYAEGDHATVAITDSGPGIPEHVRPRIFDPFFTTKPPGEGTGLGLHIVQSIVVNRHRGSVQVDSRPGHTRFEVRLPVRMAPA